MKNRLEKAQRSIVFTDEAYRLSEETFATEATDELADYLTKLKYADKLIRISAGTTEIRIVSSPQTPS